VESRLPPLSALAGDIAACVGFYTRLPVSGGSSIGRTLADAQWAAPVAGLLVGLFVALSLWLATALGVPAGVAAALALAAGIVATGALHEDGLADVADGFGGGRTPDDKLAIMKDSRIGTYGTLALGLSLVARWAALTAIAAAAPIIMVLAIVAAHAVARAAIPAMMHLLPPARPGGLSAGVGRVGAGTALAAGLIGLFAMLASGFWFALLGVLLLAGVFLVLSELARRQIGGQTGDVLGALEQAGEIAVLALAATLLI